jgi:hypothetical protein
VTGPAPTDTWPGSSKPVCGECRRTSSPVSSASSRPLRGQAGEPAAQEQAAASVDLLGVSFDRIKRELRILPPSTAKTPLKLEYYVEVQGIAPPIPIFRPGELTTGPVPYGAPTHSDILDVLTPKIFRSPEIPVLGLAIMGIQKLVEWEATRAREERLAAERLRAIEAERERQRRLKESIVISPPK